MPSHHRRAALALRAATLMLCAPTALAVQRPNDPPLPDIVPGDKSVKRGAWLAEDGQPAAPGRVPEGTDAAARERYGKLLGRLTSTERVRSFELRFEMRVRTESALNDIQRTELRYLDAGPGWVYGAFLNKDDGSIKQCQMRGPRENGSTGYWSVLKDGQVVKLLGDEFVESRDQLDGWAALSHDLLLLQQPDRLRPMRLTARTARLVGAVGDEGAAARALDFEGGDVVVLPDAQVSGANRDFKLAQRALQLEWLEIVTPDIRMWREPAGAEAARRILIGLDPATGLPELALLTPTLEGRLLAPGASLLHVTDWQPQTPAEAAPTAGQHWLPRTTRLFELRDAEGTERELAPARVVFRTRETLDLFLLGGTLGGAPPLPESFRPQ